MDIEGTKNDGESVHNSDNDDQKALSDMQSPKNESGAIQHSDNHDLRLVWQFQDERRHAHSTSPSLIKAVRDGDGDAVRRMFREGANPNVQTSDGQTALNISIQNQDMDMMHFLLEQGANTELANRKGERALYLASRFGTLSFVELLLQYGANCESFNWTANRTAFHEAVETGHIDVAKTLLDAGADIDAMISDGQTILFSAVRREDEDAVNFLLQNGANKKIRGGEGHIHLAEDFAIGGTRVMDLLQSDPLIQGPSIVDPKPTPKVPFVAPPLPAGQASKAYACRGFEGTIIDFFVGETEQRIQKTVSIYEMLYGKGPEAIMNAAKGKELEDRKRNLRWYHLPANNMEWVEILAKRHFGEQDSGEIILSDDAISKLTLATSKGQQYRTTTAQSSFMRPHYQTCKVALSPSDEEVGTEQTMLFIPFLHFETYNGHERMVRAMSKERMQASVERRLPLPGNESAFRKSQMGTKPKVSNYIPPPYIPPPNVKTKEASEDNDASSNTNTRKPTSAFKRILGNNLNFRNLRGNVRLKPQPKDNLDRSPSSTPHNDLEKGDGVRPNNDAQKASKEDTEKSDGKADRMVVEENKINDLQEGVKASEEEAGETVDEKRHKPATKTELSERANSATNLSINIDPNNKHAGRAPDSRQPELAGQEHPDSSLPTASQAPNEQVQTTTTMHEPIVSSAFVMGHREESVSIEPPKIQNSPGINTESNTKQTGKSIGADEPSATRVLGASSETPLSPKAKSEDKPKARNHHISFDKVDEALVNAYLIPYNPGEAPLQIRRTLDQYFYTHLSNTSQRDSDQVVYRYMRDQTSYEPKIFMVDQLWLWVLSDNTVISCYPQRWDIWGASRSAPRPPGPPPPPPPPPHFGHPPPHFRHPPPPGFVPPPPPPGPPFPPPPPPVVVSMPPLMTPPPVNVPKNHHSHTQGKQPIPSAHPSHTTPSKVPPPPPEPSHLGSPGIDSVSTGLNLSKGTSSPVSKAEPPKEINAMIISKSHDRDAKSSENLKRAKASGVVLGWMAGTKSKRAKSKRSPGVPLVEHFDHGPHSSAAQEKKRLELLRQDPLNVHQKVLKHLQSRMRPPITSIYDVASLVVHSCVNVFDQYQVPDEFQFFDFFERSIGVVIDKEAQCFQKFSNELARADGKLGPVNTDSDLFSIIEETRLLVEIRDIRDELGILQMILSDQLTPVEEFEEFMNKASESKTNSPRTKAPNMVIESHLYRIGKMDKLAEKTYQSLNHLLDLKQKQANVSEALSARKQMESLAQQAEAANTLAENSYEQTVLAADQAAESARQGKTVLVFTVITIIFLPLSFMAAFFAINVDVFPFNADGKLPLDYVLKYLLSISGAISIPFILVAMNQDRIAAFVKANGRNVLPATLGLLVVTILLSVIWTRNLTTGVKAAVTVFIVLTLLVCLAARIIYWMLHPAQRSDTSSTVSSSSSSGSLSDSII